MTCPLCGARRAKRECPALSRRICPVCCATKRQAEIRCPAGCIHLANARANPPATVKRQRDSDVAALLAGLGGLSQGQVQLFFLASSFFVRGVPPGDLAPVDAEVSDAAAALAATFETASRGVIFEHQAQTPGGRRMAAGLLEVLREAGRGAGSRFERQVAEVLRAIQRAAAPPADAPPGHRGFLELVGRVLREDGAEAGAEGAAQIVLP